MAAPEEEYEQQDLTIDPAKAQLGSLYYAAPLALLFCIAYYLVWKDSFTKDHLKGLLSSFGSWSMVIVFVVFLLGIVAHELIHGVTWSLYAKAGLRAMRYGVMWKFLTPYCHCREPLRVRHYITGALMPGLLLGVVPSLAGIVTGSLGLFLFGILFTIAAGGDFMIVNLLRKVPMNSLVQDHPSKIGCCIYRKKAGAGSPATT